mmetsp:Transcript_31146/g.30601  ORF Transcript_31146/g.30601 Transcript_31146/m.30601 type:complete len:85 (-) Transcript_31146:17-271(-)
MEEPMVHKSKKSLWEKIFFCCLDDYDLNDEEIKYYWKFKENMVQTFNEGNEDHEKYLKNLYITVFGTGHKKLPEKLLTNKYSIS